MWLSQSHSIYVLLNLSQIVIPNELYKMWLLHKLSRAVFTCNSVYIQRYSSKVSLRICQYQMDEIFFISHTNREDHFRILTWCGIQLILSSSHVRSMFPLFWTFYVFPHSITLLHFSCYHLTLFKMTLLSFNQVWRLISMGEPFSLLIINTKLTFTHKHLNICIYL